MDEKNKHQIKFSIDDFVEFTESKDNPEVAFNRGAFLKKNKKFEEAIIEFTKAINLGYKKSKVFADRALCYNTLRKTDLGLVDINKAISIENDDEWKALYLEVRSRIHFDNNDNVKALTDLNESCELYPTHAFEKRGDYHMKQENFYSALEDYKVMFVGNTQNAKYAFKIGYCYIRLKEIDNAKKYLNLALDAGFEQAKVLLNQIK